MLYIHYYIYIIIYTLLYIHYYIYIIIYTLLYIHYYIYIIIYTLLYIYICLYTYYSLNCSKSLASLNSFYHFWHLGMILLYIRTTIPWTKKCEVTIYIYIYMYIYIYIYIYIYTYNEIPDNHFFHFAMLVYQMVIFQQPILFTSLLYCTLYSLYMIYPFQAISPLYTRYWLVVEPALGKNESHWDDEITNIWKHRNVPNHQRAFQCIVIPR